VATLFYGSALAASFDDRVLAHLQLVIGAKLRRGEAFNFTWRSESADPPGRTTVWLHPTIPLVYSYATTRQPQINRPWIELLMTSANSVSGLQIVPEPDAAATADPDPVAE
jgi:hypothetical protein